MIVTRHRRKPFPAGRLVAAALVVLALGALFTIPQTHRMIFNSRTNDAIAKVTAPMTVAAQMRIVAERDREIARLNGALAAERKTTADRDAQITTLQQTVNQLSDELSASEHKPQAVHPRSAATPGAFSAAPADDIHRTAQYWAAMDPDRAAAIAQRVDESYAARVLAAMPADAAGEIMGALPPALAARLSQSTAPSNG